ncbi:MAG: hypothetical protein CBD39_03030 [Flavobacteriaceae bacterium TMED179]|nr:MAG: hypothetical protein CBD39_03030 [Flavobacteriaceae bacterium TMED179]|tara:strand:+ start:52302 stop:52538 length:237 start_codon:yes stop_codon:yes gene_type:complete
MRNFLWFLFISILISLAIGIYFKNSVDVVTGERIIGFTVLTGAFIYLPFFLYHRWKDKRLQDYTLSEENLKKMKKDNY